MGLDVADDPLARAIDDDTVSMSALLTYSGTLPALPSRLVAIADTGSSRRSRFIDGLALMMGLPISQPVIDDIKSTVCRTMPRESKCVLPAARHQARSEIHQLLHDRADAPSLCRMADRRQFAGQSHQSDPAQDVVGEGAQRQNQVVGIELARRQSFEVQVGLVFAVKLFAGGVTPVQVDDRLSVVLVTQRRPPTLQRDIRNQQRLAFLVDGPLGDPDDAARRTGFGIPGFHLMR
jgi:hypothetical protein